jgi:hypothetical protein
VILGFKTKFPWGEPTNFVGKILSCPHECSFLYELTPKRHTIRTGQRFRAGISIQMATGVRTKHYEQFNRNIKELETCISVQRFDLTFRSPDVVALYIDGKLKYCKNRDHLFECEPGWMKTFAINDGFNDAEHFFRWFTTSVRNGQVIHWTDHKY